MRTETQRTVVSENSWDNPCFDHNSLEGTDCRTETKTIYPIFCVNLCMWTDVRSLPFYSNKKNDNYKQCICFICEDFLIFLCKTLTYTHLLFINSVLYICNIYTYKDYSPVPWIQLVFYNKTWNYDIIDDTKLQTGVLKYTTLDL